MYSFIIGCPFLNWVSLLLLGDPFIIVGPFYNWVSLLLVGDPFIIVCPFSYWVTLLLLGVHFIKWKGMSGITPSFTLYEPGNEKRFKLVFVNTVGSDQPVLSRYSQLNSSFL